MERTECAEIQSGLGKAVAFFWGQDSAFPRLMFQKGFLDLVSAPQEGSGEECGADSFLDFWRAGKWKNTS